MSPESTPFTSSMTSQRPGGSFLENFFGVPALLDRPQNGRPVLPDPQACATGHPSRALTTVDDRPAPSPAVAPLVRLAPALPSAGA